MSLGKTPNQMNLMSSSTGYCGSRLAKNSIYALLYRESHRLFPDESFADLFDDIGRRSVPPRIVAIVMVLQRVEGLSDREAVDRFAFDLRWKYAAGGLDYDYPSFVHTVLVDMRARLRNSENPDRIFESILKVCKEAGLIGRKRVLDSTALYDAVATQDTVTLIRSGIRSVLRCKGLSSELRVQMSEAFVRDDDYISAGKPVCDWDDEGARAVLVNELATDANRVIETLETQRLDAALEKAVTLLATLVGQDLDISEDGVYSIRRGVAKDRVISVVDPEARHGHKTESRSFDGYKGHISIDPDSELIVTCDVTPGNVGDGEGAESLMQEVIEASQGDPDVSEKEAFEVYGDAAYGTADNVELLEKESINPMLKMAVPNNRNGHFTKSDFTIDMENRTVRCPNGIVVKVRIADSEDRGRARFGRHCTDCPLRSQCTNSKTGRLINIHPKEKVLQRTRAFQRHSDWRNAYRSIRPKVERKIAHLMQRRHGGRRARMRGTRRVRDDFSLLCAATNLSRLAKLDLRHEAGTWAAALVPIVVNWLILVVRGDSCLERPSCWLSQSSAKTNGYSSNTQLCQRNSRLAPVS